MIVDDDADDRSFFVEALRQVNPLTKSIEAENGREALTKLQKLEQLPDYIFLDLNMPLMNGAELMAQLAANPLLRSIPVIVYTTSISPDDAKVTRELGARFYLPKSFDLGRLPAKITFAINMVNKISLDKTS